MFWRPLRSNDWYKLWPIYPQPLRYTATRHAPLFGCTAIRHAPLFAVLPQNAPPLCALLPQYKPLLHSTATRQTSFTINCHKTHPPLHSTATRHTPSHSTATRHTPFALYYHKTNLLCTKLPQDTNLLR